MPITPPSVIHHNFKILHQNIASILSKRELLELTLQELQEMNNNPDAICLSETFIKKGNESHVKIHGYNMAANFCRDKQRGGTCILLKKNLVFKELPFIHTYATQNTFEACGIELTHHKLIIICVYRTPRSDPIQFLSKLNSLLYHVFEKYNSKINVVLAGDLNINTLQNSNITIQLQELAYNYNLKLHINCPTRKSSCIDHILSNIPNANATVMPLHLSDHDTAQMLSFPLKHKIQKQTTYSFYKRDYSLNNIQKFKECLRNVSWSEVYDEKDLNMAFNSFHELLGLFYNLCFPKLKMKVNTNSKKKQNWITKGLKQSCKTKRSLRYQYYKSKNLRNKAKYLQYSKILQKCVYTSKKNANIKYINNSENKCKAVWRVIKDEIGKDNDRDNIENLLLDNTILSDPVEIATAFNNHFTNMAQSPIKGAKISSNEYSVVHSMFLKPVSENEVRAEIMSLNNTNSEGYDEINTRIIKACTSELIEIMTYLINLSFSLGIFPESLKLSIVKPLYKTGEKSDVNNYRPITLIPIFSKIFEKCMYKRLIEFCNKFNIIRKEQFGFQKNKSTTLAIYSLLKIVLTNINHNYFTTGLFFDLSKAFDLVSHDMLLQKLEATGIRGITLQWLSSYLSNRQQRVTVTKIDTSNNMTSHYSEFKSNKQGVPQGSVLGPILFLLYINSIITITNHKCILFADDISIIVTSDKKSNTIKDHETEINNVIERLIKWLKENNLSINLKKSVYIQFNKSNNVKHNIKMTIHRIHEVTQTKFLGVTLDQDINWKAHVDTVSKRINKFVYALKQIRNITNIKTSVTTYRAYVESVLRYGLIMWGNSTDQNRAFVAQKRCIRALCGLKPDESCRPMFKKLDLLPLPSLYIFEICLFVWRHKELFVKASDVNSRSRRDPYRLVLDVLPRLAKYNKSCMFMCVQVYNRIPDELKILNTRMFKTKLYKWLSASSFYSVKEFLEHKIA